MSGKRNFTQIISDSQYQGPKFRTRVMEAIRQSRPSIVTSLPTSPSAGQQAIYRPGNGQVPWHLQWDPALRSGNGAWAYVGGPAMQVVAAGGGTNVIPNTGTHHVTGTPVLTVPANGRYRLTMALALQAQSVGLTDLFVGLHKVSNGTPSLMGWVDYPVSLNRYQSVSVHAPFQETTLLTGDVVRMVMASSTGGTFGSSSSVTKIIDLHPVYLTA